MRACSALMGTGILFIRAVLAVEKCLVPPDFRIDFETRPSDEAMAEMKSIREFFSPPQTLKVQRARTYRNSKEVAVAEKARARRLEKYQRQCQDWEDLFKFRSLWRLHCALQLAWCPLSLPIS